MSSHLRKLHYIEIFLVALASTCIVWGIFSLSKQQKIEQQEILFSQNTFIDGQFVGGLTAARTSAFLQKHDQLQATTPFTIFFGQIKVASTAAELSMKKNNDEVINEALAAQLKQKDQQLWKNWQKFFAPPAKQEFFTTTSFDPAAVTQMATEFQKKPPNPDVNPAPHCVFPAQCELSKSIQAS